MRPNTHYSDNTPSSINITSTNSGKTITVEVASRSDKAITVFLANEKITLYRDGDVYVANRYGMELVYKP